MPRNYHPSSTKRIVASLSDFGGPPTKVEHELSTDGLRHRLHINGRAGAWAKWGDMAHCGDYVATTEEWRRTFPEVFCKKEVHFTRSFFDASFEDRH
jgi:hypothetical protein